jgi:hypothetical protein
VAGKCGRSGPPAGNTNGVTHGYYSLKARLSGADLDKRTAAYKPLAEKEQELIAALGGDVSPQERIIIADTVKHLLFAASLDRYLMQLKSLVRKGKIHGVVSERTKIGAHIRENLKTLGLKRVSKEISLSDYLSEKYGEQDSGKSRSNVHVNKTVPDRQASVSVEKKELDA